MLEIIQTVPIIGRSSDGKEFHTHHVGIYMGNGQILEANETAGYVIVQDIIQTEDYFIEFVSPIFQLICYILEVKELYKKNRSSYGNASFGCGCLSAFRRKGICGCRATQQQGNIKGTVVDSNGEPIIGANVIIEGTTTGTITDIDGNFTLEVPTDAQLAVSYIGYKKVIIPVNGKTNFTIKMEDDA